MTDIRTALQGYLTAEQKAESDAEMAEKYPEHMKFDKVRDESQAIGLFLDQSEYVLATWPDDSRYPVPVHKSINDILAEYFEIDMKVLEDEKQRMLAALASPKA